MHGTFWFLAIMLAVLLGAALAASVGAATPDEWAIQRADDALQEQIEAALQADPALQDSRISVQFVHQGMVLLTGMAQTLSAHLHAVAVVTRVPGVWWIASTIQSPAILVEEAIWRAPMLHQSHTAYGPGGGGPRYEVLISTGN
jgi:hypothetical protein